MDETEVSQRRMGDRTGHDGTGRNAAKAAGGEAALRPDAGNVSTDAQARVPADGSAEVFNEALTMAMWVRSTVADYEKPLTRYAAAITGDAEIARDVVQDTFLKLCAADRAALNGRLAAWLYTTCRNGAIDVRRKSRRVKPIGDADVDMHTTREPSPGSVAEQKETAGEMLRLVELLPDNQREVIRLRFQGGLKYREISEVTGLTVSNVGFLIHTAIATIRERMSEPSDG